MQVHHPRVPSTSKRLRRLAGLCVAVAAWLMLTPSPALAATESAWSWQTQWLGAAVNVALIGFLIWKFAAPGMRRFLSKRKEGIDREMAEAEALRTRAETRLDELETRIASLDAERARVLDEYRAIGESEKERIVEQARRDAQRIRRDAETWSETELARARHIIEREITALALQLAEQKLRAELQPARQKELVEQAITSLVSYGEAAPLAAQAGERRTRPGLPPPS